MGSAGGRWSGAAKLNGPLLRPVSRCAHVTSRSAAGREQWRAQKKGADGFLTVDAWSHSSEE